MPCSMSVATAESPAAAPSISLTTPAYASSGRSSWGNIVRAAASTVAREWSESWCGMVLPLVANSLRPGARAEPTAGRRILPPAGAPCFMR